LIGSAICPIGTNVPNADRGRCVKTHDTNLQYHYFLRWQILGEPRMVVGSQPLEIDAMYATC